MSFLKNKFRKYFLDICIILIDMLGILIGIALAWQFATIPKLKSINGENTMDRQLTSVECIWLTSITYLSAVLGSWTFAFSAENIGFRPAIILASFILSLSNLLLTHGNSVQLLCAGRTVAGLAIGGLLTTAPLYIGETCASRRRAAAGSTLNIFIVTGILITYTIGPLVTVWSLSLYCTIFGFIVSALLYFIIPESPHYLIRTRNEFQAKDVLIRMRSTSMVDIEFRSMYDEVRHLVPSEGTRCCWQLFRERSNLKVLMILIALIVLQQLSCANLILLNMRSIFERFNRVISPAKGACIVGVGQLLGSLLAPLLLDRCSRKLVLFVSAIVITMCQILLGIYFFLESSMAKDDIGAIHWMPIVAMVVLFVFYNLGIASSPWIVAVEILRPDIKQSAMAIANSVGFSFNFLFSQMCFSIGGLTSVAIATMFCLFAIFNMAVMFFVILYLPESRAKSWMEIYSFLEG